MAHAKDLTVGLKVRFNTACFSDADSRSEHGEYEGTVAEVENLHLESLRTWLKFKDIRIGGYLGNYFHSFDLFEVVNA